MSRIGHRLPSAYTLFNRLMSLPAWIAESLRSSKKPGRESVKLNIENMEERIVPSTASIIYDVSDDGGISTSGLNRTLTIGQTLVVEVDVAADVGGSPSPESPTPTGTVTFQLESTSIFGPTYTVGTVSLSSVTTGEGGAELITSVLPTTAGTYDLNLSYGGDSNYSTSNSSDVAVITMQSPPTGAPADLAPASTGGLIQLPSGDNIATAAVAPQTGVVYGTGAINVSRTDLTSNGFGTPWGESWNWTNAVGYTDGLSGAGEASGTGGLQTQAPHLVQINGDSGIAVVTTGSSAYFFDLWGDSYHARFGLDAALTHDTTDHWYVLTVAGSTYTFNDFSGDGPDGQEGALLSVTDAYGDTTSAVSWNGAGAVTEVDQSSGSGASEVYQKFVSTYISSGVNEGLLSSVAQEYKIGSGSWTTIETSDYTYYGSSDSYGEEGELETALVYDASDNLMNAAYYRYYVSSGGGGLIGLGGGGGGGGDGGSSDAGLLEYVFNAEGYEQLVATYGSDIDSVSNDDASPYAEMTFGYGDNEIGTVGIAGIGGGTNMTLAIGEGYSYGYDSNTESSTGLLDPNVWTTLTIEGLPGDSTNYVYTNALGQVMLTDFDDSTTDVSSYTYYRYNSSDQLVMVASPSAVTGFSVSDSDLVGWSGGSATYLSSSSGLITTYTYPSSTTATTSVAGNVVDYLEQTAIQQGTGGTSIPQSSYTYIQNSAGGVTVTQVASQTVYSETGGDGAETTSYAYTYYSDTNAVYSVTTTLPTITTGQNGSNSANTTETVFSTYGQPIWTLDPEGYIDFTAYDPLTGAVTEQITDVKTSDDGDYSNLPDDWSTMEGAGLNLVTSYIVDDMGRVTEETTPNGNVDYFVYIDADMETREYDGWNSDTHTATGPTKVTIDDLAAGFTDSLTMTATPAVSDGVPTGGESIADVQSMTRTFVNLGGQTTEVDSYFNLGGLAYTSGAMGTSGVNYYATLYGYDINGNQDETISPQGTIYITVYDGQGRKVSTWVGTDATPSSGTWSPTNNSSPCNMVETESFTYDGGDAGDSDLTQTIQYPDGDTGERVTDYWYNWRDQLVAEKDGVGESEDDGVNRPLTVYTLDNLGEVTETQVYSGDGVTPTISSGELSLGDIASDLQAESVSSYDNQGQVYQTQVFSVNPTNGDVSETALTTENYYDANGNLIATSAPGGLWTKDVYDGAGRQVMEYQTDGGSGTSYAEAGTVSGDVVLTQTQTDYDGDGNVIETITSDRFNTDSTSSFGALAPTGDVDARVYYSGNYYDLADRLTASVNVGTNEGSAWDMPDSAPAPSADALVTTYGFAADAVQWVTLTGSPTGGTFTLTFGGDTTSSIAYNASASTVQSDLAALGSIGSGNVEVTLVPGGGWQVHFTGSLADEYQSQITATSSLTGGTSPGVSVSTLSLGGDNGNVIDTTDPDEIDTRDYYNSLGEVVQSIQNYTDGVVSASSNKTTDYTYNSVGQTSLTADMGNGTGETTEWVYGVTIGDDSVIDSNDVVGVTEQPNPSTGLPDTSLETTVTVDGLGETLTSTDPDGTTHTYTYDVLGQQTADSASFAEGDPADETETEITTSYTTLGNPYLTTTYDGDTVANQVEDVYNGLAQLAQEYQSVSGSVNTEATPSVQYVYSDLADGNNSRLTEIIYPDGYSVDYNYASGLDNNISRLTSISDDTGTLESYQYLGLSTIVEMDHPETGINLTYISTDDGTGVAGDQYVGLDQFGRVIDQNWYDTSTDTSVYNEQYGFDDDGNVVWEIDDVNANFGALYQYDGLGQLTSYWQGDVMLSGGVVGISGSPTIEESWTYDPLGNHLVDSTTTTGTTTVTSTFNLDNQIASMSGYTTPTYDYDGNMTKDQNDLTYVYNAWGQLVTVKNSGGTTLESYTYDGLGDRMTNTVSGTQTNFYYSTSGQVLEEQANSTGDYTQRYVWSPNYINEMINRDTDTSGTGLTATGTSFTRYWTIQDANYDVVALVTVSDSIASVVERYEYDPFGTQTVLSASYATEEGSSYGWVYGFQGMRLDGTTGNSLTLTREEDPTTGTWTGMDPKGFGGGEDDLYSFVGNEPINRHDPSGLQSQQTPPVSVPAGSGSNSYYPQLPPTGSVPNSFPQLPMTGYPGPLGFSYPPNLTVNNPLIGGPLSLEPIPPYNPAESPILQMTPISYLMYLQSNTSSLMGSGVPPITHPFVGPIFTSDPTLINFLSTYNSADHNITSSPVFGWALGNNSWNHSQIMGNTWSSQIWSNGIFSGEVHLGTLGGGPNGQMLDINGVPLWKANITLTGELVYHF